MLRFLTRLYLLALLAGTMVAPYLSRDWPALARVGLGLLLAIQWLPVISLLAWRWLNPPTTAFMLLTRAELRRQGRPDTLAHTWVSMNELSPALLLAAVAGEDLYFAIHSGFDWESLLAAYRNNRAGGARRGGSTITQQTAKNLFLWETPSVARKLIEAYLTCVIEALWPKRRLLEVYLNIAQFGPNIFGVEAGAQKYFGKPNRAVSPQEAALLITVLPDPRHYRADQPSPQMRFRQVMILGTMKKLGQGYLARLDARPQPTLP